MAKKKKRKKKKKPSDPPDIHTLRGVCSSDVNEIILLVRAPVEQAATAFGSHRKLKTHLADIVGKTIEIDAPSYLVYQLVGHAWTIIDSFAGNAYVDVADAKEISKKLRARVIYYGNSDTAGVVSYELFERGKSLERLDYCEELEFESSVRDARDVPDESNLDEFTDRFIRSEDAFTPGWSTALSWNRNAGEKVKIDFWDETMVSRADYVGK
jgi:hypothetical protein